MAACNSRCAYITLLVLGAVFVIVGVVILFELPKVVHDQVSAQMPLKNGTDVYKAWVDPPVPVYMQFWVWDLVNTEDFVQFGAKPKLQQKGPYTYRELRPKKNITFTSNGSLVSYVQPKSYVFQRHLSVGPDNDTFTTVNFPLLALVTMARFKLAVWQEEILAPFLVLLGERLYKPYTVHQYLWGFPDPVIQTINNFTRAHFNRTLIANETFGLFYGPTGNGTADGDYTIFTGTEDLHQYMEISKWQNSKTVNYWNSKYCNMINGTDGSGWHPFINKSETLYIYSSDVCRSVYTRFSGEVTVQGIPMYRFSPPDAVLANSSVNPANMGYCTPDCLGSGVLNISVCRDGAPVIISQPHFYQGDPKFVNAFEGIHPNPEEHATVLDIEPITGAALNAEKRLQLNFYIRPSKLLQDTRLMNNTIFPVVWLNESGKITPSVAAAFRARVSVMVELSVVLPWVVLGVGIVMVLCGAGVCVYAAVRSKSTSQMSPIVAADDGDEDDAGRGLLSSNDPQTNYSSTERA